MIEVPMRPIAKKSRCIEAIYQRTALEKKQRDADNASRTEVISVPRVLMHSTIEAASMKKAHQKRISKINTVAGFFWATANHPTRSLHDRGCASRGPKPSIRFLGAAVIGRLSPGSLQTMGRINANPGNIRAMINCTPCSLSIRLTLLNEVVTSWLSSSCTGRP